MNKKNHQYHIIDPSPLPLFTSISFLILSIGAIGYLHNYKGGTVVFFIGIAMLLSCMFSWWRDIINEAIDDKAHTKVVGKGLTLGMLIFIISEIMFFFVFFWAFFNSSIAPTPIFGETVWPISEGQWPPKNIETLNPWNVPFLNTLILLLSGTTVTWAHYALINYEKENLLTALKLTVGLGIIFTLLQVLEYHHAAFGFKEGVYASIFYMLTGFHGAHVIIGTIFLYVCLKRAEKGHFDKGNNHLGFIFAAWYWHFVDVVWLLVFVFVYIWGS